MMKMNLGSAIQTLANVGVIAGIVFLGFELQQNNKLMEAEARDVRNVRIQDFIQQAYMVPGLAEIILKVREGEPLTAIEKIKLRSRQGRQLRGFQAQWTESIVGVGASPNASNIRTFFYEGGYYTTPLDDAWEEIKPTLSPEFVEWMEENVIR